MIISGKQIQNITKLYGDQTKVSKTAKSQSANSLQGKDEVILSSRAQEFSNLLQQAKNMPEVREDRVQELAEKIKSGNYKVSSEEVAEKMLGRLQADRLR